MAFGVSPVTRKSKTLTGLSPAAGSFRRVGGEGAAGGALTTDIALPVSTSGASSMYALRGLCFGSEILTVFFAGFSL